MKFNFPKTEKEAKNWEPYFTYIVIHWKVLVVAKTRIEGKWNAYATPVPGMSHEKEYYLWETEGLKLPEEIARVMFPDFKELPYAR